MTSSLFIGNWRPSHSHNNDDSANEVERPFLVKKTGSFHSTAQIVQDRRSDASFLSAPDIVESSGSRGSTGSVSSKSHDSKMQSGGESTGCGSTRTKMSYSNRSFADFEEHNKEEAVSFQAANLLHPSESILVHPEARPYAQLCYNPHLGTLTTLLVGNRGPYRAGFLRNKKESILSPKILTETQPGQEMVEILLSTSISSSSSPCSSGVSTSSSETNESGWSTGEDSSYKSTMSSGSDQLVDAIMWIDQEWMETSKKDYYLYEQGQSLLQQQDPIFTPSPAVHRKSFRSCFPCPCHSSPKLSGEKRASKARRKSDNQRPEKSQEDTRRYATLME